MTLSDKLRTVAEKLEAGTLEFDWMNRSKCCCGVVAQMLLGKSSEEIGQMMPVGTQGTVASWKNIVNRTCPITGRPTESIFAQLYDAGLTRDDIIHLEYLSDPAVLALCPKLKQETTKGFWPFKRKVFVPIDYKKENSICLAFYLRGLAELKEKIVLIKETEPFVLVNRLTQN